MRANGKFKVLDFLNEYKKNSPLRSEKLFHHNNTGKMIDAYVKKHGINIEFQAKKRLWFFLDNENENNSDDKLVANSVN